VPDLGDLAASSSVCCNEVLLNADEPQCLRRMDDGDAGMTAQRQQMLAITGNDQVGMLLVHMAGARARRTKGWDRSEKIAVIALMAAVLLVSYLVMTHLARMYMVPVGLDGSIGSGGGG
jgi:hypothetical protein